MLILHPKEVLCITLAIVPPVTIKTEELEAVFRSKPTTIVSIGIYNPPPPMPPALDIEAAMKQKTPASTIEGSSFSPVS
ncbi:hypothetical protein OIU84_013968 [Salix udensis]|uniref:Uncharacterized protein n=1 Tax=Salix udensis TaxID=889485 RepID=A0AAD6JAZ2_9ROSI|nr:hypothetical protein OIU84_013968 [Salix udensis]